MKGKSVTQFESLYPKFKMREQQIPENLRWKLLFIAERIYKTNLKPRQLSSREKQQVQDLINLDTNTLAIFFNFMVKSLLVDKKPQERQCKIKYPGVFQFWKNCRVNVDRKYFFIAGEKSIHQYELKFIDISNCRKSKNTFDLFFKNKILVYVKFGSKDVFREFLAQLQSSLEMAKEKQVHEQSAILTTKRQKEVDFEDRHNQTAIVQSVPQVIEKKKQGDLIDDKPNGYQIIEENQGLLICLKEGEPRLYISVLMTAQCPLQKIVNFYIQQKEWNGIVNLQQIKQEGENVFQIYRSYKKQSMMQTQKSTFTSLNVFCSKQSANIIEQSIQDDFEGVTEKVQCEIKSHTKFYRCLGGTKIIIDTQLKIKGYSNPKYAIMFMTKLYSQLKYLQNSFKISQLQKNKLRNIINFTNEFKEEIKNRQYSRLRTEEHSPKKGSADLLDTNDTLELKPNKVELKPNKVESEIINQNVFLKIKPASPPVKPTMEFIQMIQKFEHQRCYLTYRFNQNILTKYDSYLPFYALSQILKKGTEYRITKDNELIYINEEVLNGQKDSLKFIIRQIGANILTGKSVLNVSMPVDIFQSRSLLERGAGAYGSVSDYLLPVADAQPLTQMKHVLAFIVSIPTLELLMQKPFNPILGETFQAYIKGIPIYYEQISHHPPISAFYMKCPQFTMYGQLAAFADISINSAVGGNQGCTHIIFRNGNHFKCFYPPCQISGLIFGQRSFRAYGRGYIMEQKSNMFAEFSIQKQKKGLYEQEEKMTQADLIGGIFKVNPSFMQEIISQNTLRSFSGITKKQVESKLAQVKGVWFKEIKINGEIINKNIKIYPLQYPKITLPSDSNYRQDILYHKMNDLGQSQKMKEVLQVNQRGDRKLRQKYAKLAKKR